MHTQYGLPRTVCCMIKKINQQSVIYICQGFLCLRKKRLFMSVVAKFIVIEMTDCQITRTISNSDVILMLCCHTGVVVCQVILKALCPLAVIISGNDQCDCWELFKLGSEVWQQATFDLRRQRSKVPFSALVCLFALKQMLLNSD